MRCLILFLGISLSALATEHYVNVVPSIGLKSFARDSGLELDYRLVHAVDERSVIINPKIIGTISKEVRSAVGLGVRHEMGNWTTGVFAFFHHSFFDSAHLFQAGPTIELLGNFIDIRMNIFAPVGGSKKFANDPYVETEISYKNEFFQVGAGPCFNVEKRKMGYLSRLSVPIGFGSICLHLGKDPLQGFVGKLSFTILRFGNSTSSNMGNIFTKRMCDKLGSPRSEEVIRDCPPLIPLPPSIKPSPLNQYIERATVPPIVIERAMENSSYPDAAKRVQKLKEESGWWDRYWGDNNPLFDPSK